MSDAIGWHRSTPIPDAAGRIVGVIGSDLKVDSPRVEFHQVIEPCLASVRLRSLLGEEEWPAFLLLRGATCGGDRQKRDTEDGRSGSLYRPFPQPVNHFLALPR